MGLHQASISLHNGLYPHYYLCHYLPVTVGKDTLSRSLLKFKEGRQPDLDGWIDCSLEIFGPAPIPPDTLIVRALHHDETATTGDSPNSLDLLGQALAHHLQARYLPQLLEKSSTCRSVKGFSRIEREDELRGRYTVPPPYRETLAAAPSLLIIDDILTTGTTIKMIITALRKYTQIDNFQSFTLARATLDPTDNQAASLQGQNYRLEEGTYWQVAEEPAPYEYTIKQLKTWIRTDIF